MRAGYVKLVWLLLFFCSPIFAWNIMGHEVVAQIAYDNLTPTAREQVEQLIPFMGKSYHIKQMYQAAAWPDRIKQFNVTAYNNWHYINQPIGATSSTLTLNPENVVWAIAQSKQVLTTPAVKSYRQQQLLQQSQFLFFLLHFVGDIHQPLHTVVLYNKTFPHGDGGGNFYLIKSPFAKNLHQYWDMGGGIFKTTHPSKNAIQQCALKIQMLYPKSQFSAQIQDLNPQNWAHESLELAQQQVYTIPFNSKPSKAYQAKVQDLTQQQAALAGYRLAAILNSLFI